MTMNILYELAYSFLKVGFFGFGGGFAMIPLMHSVAVYRHAWLSSAQFGVAVSLGQVTPGPVAISATFIGYKVAGLPGALLATIAVFTPSLLIMYLLERFYLKERKNEITHAIMHGIMPVIVALILLAAVSLGRPAVHSWWQALVVVTVAVLAITRRVSYGLLVLGCMAVGALMGL
jgi:chromate transporter